MAELLTFTPSSCLVCEADDSAMRFFHKPPILPSDVAVASQLTFGEWVAELGLDDHDSQQRIVHGRREADLKVDSVLFGKGLRPVEGAVVRKVWNA